MPDETPDEQKKKHAADNPDAPQVGELPRKAEDRVRDARDQAVMDADHKQSQDMDRVGPAVANQDDDIPKNSERVADQTAAAAKDAAKTAADEKKLTEGGNK